MYLLFIIIASFLHSVKENIEYDFGSTRFVNKNPVFWNPIISQVRAKKIIGIRLDAITLFDIAGFLIITTAIVLSQLNFFHIKRSFMGIGWQIILAVAIYIITYNISTIHYVKRTSKRTSTTSDATNQEK